MKISLRPYKLSDVEEFMEWACDDRVVSQSRLSHYSTKEEAEAYLKEEAIPHPWYRAICLEGRPIGFLCVTPGSGSLRCKGVIGYALGSKFWGQGITTRAVEMAVPCVFDEFPDLQRVEGYVHVANVASQRVLEKAGFSKEGILRRYLVVEGKAVDVGGTWGSAITNNKIMEISLRPYKLSDVEEFMEWTRDDQVVSKSRLSHYTTKEEAKAYLKEEAMPHPWYRAICLEGRPIGFLCVTPGSGTLRCKGVISYALGSKFWGQGITTRAVEMAVPCVFDEFPDLQRVEGFVDVANVASQRVLEKAGFLKEGILRRYLVLEGKVVDAAMYSVLRN